MELLGKKEYLKGELTGRTACERKNKWRKFLKNVRKSDRYRNKEDPTYKQVPKGEIQSNGREHILKTIIQEIFHPEIKEETRICILTKYITSLGKNNPE